jgi:hypothetical protein
MGGRSLGLMLAAVGVVVFFVSAFAEPLGLGDDNGIQGKQIAGMVVGGIVVAVGLGLTYLRRGGASTAPQAE